ncbi:hypothetical protein D3C75_1252030 [compost metagenome]
MERKRCVRDLTVQSEENIEFMIEEIKNKLRMATGAAMTASSFSLDRYEDIHEVYDIVMSKERLSISEVEALAKELGSLRK